MTEPAKTPQRYDYDFSSDEVTSLVIKPNGRFCMYSDLESRDQRIAELEAALDARTSCRCGTDLDLHCSDVGCDHNKKDYGGFYLDRVQPWLDKPDKPGWWLVQQDGDGGGYPKYDAKYLYESDMNWESHERVYKGCFWRFISE